MTALCLPPAGSPPLPLSLSKLGFFKRMSTASGTEAAEALAAQRSAAIDALIAEDAKTRRQNYSSRQRRCSVVILGGPGVGKKTFLRAAQLRANAGSESESAVEGTTARAASSATGTPSATITTPSGVANDLVSHCTITLLSPQSGQRRKWINQLENVDGIVYVVDLSAFDRLVWDEENEREVNALRQDMNAFQELCSHRDFLRGRHNLEIILNKSDLFALRLRTPSGARAFRALFPTYPVGGSGSVSHAEATQWIGREYQRRFLQRDPWRTARDEECGARATSLLDGDAAAGTLSAVLASLTRPRMMVVHCFGT
ncbi:CRE-GPA-2 protein [Mycena chlorophos]|uniref:CRE-GPA-2 protein n=1 Tax=Mycena chlorophos TaxID=658473 RepID=A0A8H6SKH2_MYCCL|nr:CRE-GPA-2 protein [Mycena chlorophos]